MNTFGRSLHRLMFGWSWCGQLHRRTIGNLGKKESFLSAGGFGKACDVLS